LKSRFFFLRNRVSEKNVKTRSFKPVSFVSPSKKIVDSEKREKISLPLFLKNNCDSEFEDYAPICKV